MSREHKKMIEDFKALMHKPFADREHWTTERQRRINELTYMVNLNTKLEDDGTVGM